MSHYLTSIVNWINSTQIPHQIQVVDAKGLFHNPYFLVPFILFIVYLLYKQSVNNLVVTAVCLGLWWFSGTEIVKGALVDGIVQLDKVLPIAGVGITSIAILVYFLFIRQD